MPCYEESKHQFQDNSNNKTVNKTFLHHDLNNSICRISAYNVHILLVQTENTGQSYKPQLTWFQDVFYITV